MKKIVKLPFEEKPLCIMYQHIAFPLGIVQGNAKSRHLPVLFSKYIKCTYDKNGGPSKFIIGDDFWFDKVKLIKRYNLLIDNVIYKNNSFELLKIMRKMLEKGYYVEGNCNENWIPGKSCYKKTYFFHTFILIGYNDVERIFYSVGFLKNKEFQCYKITYDDMIKAIETADECNIKIQFREYNFSCSLTFDVSETFSVLKEYINPEKNYDDMDKFYGIDAIETLCNEISISQFADYRYTRGLMEHKNFINMYVKYLYENNYLDDHNLVETSQTVLDISKKLHLIVVKHMMVQKKCPVDKVVELMKKIVDLEKYYISKIIQVLGKRGNNV